MKEFMEKIELFVMEDDSAWTPTKQRKEILHFPESWNDPKHA